MKLAFKAFDKDMKCRGHKFEIGITYRTNCTGVPRLCTQDGYHYCEDIVNLREFYPDGTSRICIIEVLGPFSSDSKKSTTTAFRIIRDITYINRDVVKSLALKFDEEIDYEFKKSQRDGQESIILQQLDAKIRNELLKKELRAEIEAEAKKDKEREELAMASALNLDQVRKIQEKFPLLHVGGSAGLFLHGVRLKRMQNGEHDLDLIAPYFMLYENVEGITFQHNDPKSSGNDFDQTFTMTTDEGTVKVDVRIDPKQAYEIVKYNGFDYKVSKLEVIWEAKMRYTAYNNTKHKEDLYDAMGTNKWRDELTLRNSIKKV